MGVDNPRWHEPTCSAARGAKTGCAPGRFENNSKSSATSLDLIPTLRSFGSSSTIQMGRISPGPGACTACPSCLRVLCTCLRVPCLRLCFCQPACVDRYCVPARTCGACAGPLCANTLHLFARVFPVPACVLCLHLVDILNCSHDHWGMAPPLNHGRAASTLTIGARQRLFWLTLFSPLASVCTTETLNLSLHTHNTLTCNNPPPHTHTQTRHVSTLDKIVSKYSSQSPAHITESIPCMRSSVHVPSLNSQPWRFTNNSLGLHPPSLSVCLFL